MTRWHGARGRSAEAARPSPNSPEGPRPSGANIANEKAAPPPAGAAASGMTSRRRRHLETAEHGRRSAGGEPGRVPTGRRVRRGPPAQPPPWAGPARLPSLGPPRGGGTSGWDPPVLRWAAAWGHRRLPVGAPGPHRGPASRIHTIGARSDLPTRHGAEAGRAGARAAVLAAAVGVPVAILVSQACASAVTSPATSPTPGRPSGRGRSGVGSLRTALTAAEKSAGHLHIDLVRSGRR